MNEPGQEERNCSAFGQMKFAYVERRRLARGVKMGIRVLGGAMRQVFATNCSCCLLTF